MKIYIENTYLYYNNTPDLENQIEYINYTGLSSSIDENSSNLMSTNNNENNPSFKDSPKFTKNEIKCISNNNTIYQRYNNDEKEEEKDKIIKNIDIQNENEGINNLVKVKDNNKFDISSNNKNDSIKDEIENENIFDENILFKESLYSKEINKTIDNINSMLDEINEINNNNIKGIKLNKKKNKEDNFVKENENINNNIDKSDENEKNINKNKILKIKEGKNIPVDKDEILEKILLDYNSELREIKTK